MPRLPMTPLQRRFDIYSRPTTEWDTAVLSSFSVISEEADLPDESIMSQSHTEASGSTYDNTAEIAMSSFPLSFGTSYTNENGNTVTNPPNIKKNRVYMFYKNPRPSLDRIRPRMRFYIYRRWDRHHARNMPRVDDERFCIITPDEEDTKDLLNNYPEYWQRLARTSCDKIVNRSIERKVLRHIAKSHTNSYTV